MSDLAPEKAMEEILHKLQREYAEEGKQEPQPAAAAPRSAEVLSLNQANDSRKGRSGNRAEASPDPDGQDVQPGKTDDASQPISAGATGSAMAAFAELAAIRRERRRANEFPVGNSTCTLEDMLREALRPMLQGWLDDKLPEIVERLVRAEVSRAIGEI